jgi:ferrous iron transport protein B
MRIKIALCGCPNTGKTTLYNKITNSLKKVANYPGVTVDKSEGIYKYLDTSINIIDLPGLNSLNAFSEEEDIAKDYLLNDSPDLIVNVIDASNLERSLFLTIQLLELGHPVVIALNKLDLAKKRKTYIDIKRLSEILKVPVVELYSHDKSTVQNLIKTSINSLKSKIRHNTSLYFSKNIEEGIENIKNSLFDYLKIQDNTYLKYLSIKLLEKDEWVKNKILLNIPDCITTTINSLQSQIKDNMSGKMAQLRYKYISDICSKVLSIPDKLTSKTDKLDSLLTHRFWGIPIFIGILYFTFYFTFVLASYPTQWLTDLFSHVNQVISGSFIKTLNPIIYSLITEGIVSGVGYVITFLPNILFLFFSLSLLENSGYIARAAFIMDKILYKVGLQGKSIIPFLIGCGCTVPAILSTRILDNKKDKLITIMVLPFIACSAKMTVFALLISVFFPLSYRALIMLGIYLFGFLLTIIAAKILSKKIKQDNPLPFIMEMPSYKIPKFKEVTVHMLQMGLDYLKKAGTSIFIIAIALWFLCNFPKDNENTNQDYQKNKIALIDYTLSEVNDSHQLQKIVSVYIKDSVLKTNDLSIDEKTIVSNICEKYDNSLDNLKLKKRSLELTNSYLGKFGKTLEKFTYPLGFDWKVNIALIGSLAAKELFITQLGIIYSIDGNSFDLLSKLKHDYSPLVGLCIIVFMMINTPCIATLAAIKQELKKTRYVIFQLLILFFVAYIVTFITYQIGKLCF